MISLRKTAPLVLLLLLAAAGVIAAGADCKTCTYTKRGDRYEGVGARQVSGGSFELLGVEYVSGDKPAAAGDQAHLSFWLPAPETPTIEVWEPRTNYWMVPDRRPFDKGFQTYSWPRSEVLAPLGVDLASLYPKISNRDKTLYYPASVGTGPKPSPNGRYVFIFRSGAGIDVYCTLSRQENGTIVPVRKFRFSEELGGTLRLPWDGLDDAGKPAPDGTYVLRLKGEMMAETLRPLTFNLSFLHHLHRDHAD